MSYYQQISAFDFDQPYSLNSTEKKRLFLHLLNELSAHHLKNSPYYSKIAVNLPYPTIASNLEEVLFLPVRLFKHLDLMSIPRSDVFKILTSSGTSGQSVSRIFLSRDNSAMQTKVLGSIVSNFIGKQRNPMVVIDTEEILKDRSKFNARAAGVLGFSMYGKDHTYALDASMSLNIDMLEAYCEKYREKGIFSFGFTFIIWKFLYQQLNKYNVQLDFGPNSILIHGGGWKKLNEESISNDVFKAKLLDRTGLRRVHNYYGMVEQTGSIFMECDYGHLHTSNYSEVIIRDQITFKPCAYGELGLVQIISLLPHSYPGHSLLSEDLGVLLGEDDCLCGRMGKYFHVLGRVKTAEVRGCSDVRQF